MVAKELLDVVWPYATETDQQTMHVRRRMLLQDLLGNDPGNIELISQLGLVYEYQGDADAAKNLLEPVADGLGVSEGRRILGQLYLLQGDIENAEAHLRAYLERWLPLLAETEAQNQHAESHIWEETVSRLNRVVFPRN